MSERTAADVIPTDQIVEGLKSIESAVHTGNWNGELAWLVRACRRLTGEDGYVAPSPAVKAVTPDADVIPAGSITGKRIELSEGRSVFVGRHGDMALISFKNRRGDVTNIAISQEARGALVQLLLEDCA